MVRMASPTRISERWKRQTLRQVVSITKVKYPGKPVKTACELAVDVAANQFKDRIAQPNPPPKLLDFCQGVAETILARQDKEAFSASVETRLDSQRVTDFLRPRIELLRMKIFGSPKPPFRSLKAAWKWIEAESNKMIVPSKIPLAALRKIFQPGLDALEKAGITKPIAASSVQTGEMLPLEASALFRPTLPFAKSGDSNIVSFSCPPNSPLERIAVATKELTEDFWGSAERNIHVRVVCFFFVDEPIILPYASIHTSLAFGGLEHSSFTVTYHRPLSGKELAKIHDRLRDFWQFRRRRPPAADSIDFLALVKRLGGAPQKRGLGIPFWTRVRQEWDKTHPGEIAGWGSAWKKYRRLTKEASKKTVVNSVVK
jgi:hypothetical protein